MDEEALGARGLVVGYRGHEVIDGLDLALMRGRITAIIGANGCGKSTLLWALSRLLPSEGTVVLDGRDTATLSTREIARRLSVLPQGPSAPEGLTVADLVARGRYPHQKWLRQWSEADEAAVREALERTNMTAFAGRPIDELSGGQRQKAWIAMALAQRTDTVLLDEPTTYLDIGHQAEVLDLLVELNVSAGRTIVLVLHDLNQAARYADRVIAMERGRIAADGTPDEVITAETLRAVFGVEAHVVADPHSGAPLVIPASVPPAVRRAAQPTS
ncbi:ABC transporter ATP-binding protein [Microtetraspora malaysiensis]|uniref:ABC transporter ATP-binding protein n=1 Tax=Microtetraspora malaysiensis TaxID=161358 RepID=UPI000835D95C|nr:ABC transporter ATP-binding protein [Microtetraspora malaysiensis]